MWCALLLPALALAAPAEGDEARRLFFGGQLAITAEPAPEGGAEVSLNVVPLVVEWAFTDRVGLRAATVLNLQVAGDRTGLAHRGVGLTLPVYLPGPNDTAPYQGFYVGPHGAYTVNPLVGGRDVTASAELGVRWEVLPRCSLNLAAQGGATWLDRPAGGSGWVSHVGFFPSFGVWLRP